MEEEEEEAAHLPVLGPLPRGSGRPEGDPVAWEEEEGEEEEVEMEPSRRWSTCPVCPLLPLHLLPPFPEACRGEWRGFIR